MLADTTYAINPTVEEIVRECDSAWSRARELIAEFNACATKDESAREESIYVTLAREHAELNKTYPVILAAMAAGSYHARAVRKFFKYVQHHLWRTEEEFLEVQTVYNAILYRVTHPRAHGTAVAQIRQRTRKALDENTQKTKEQIASAQRDADEINARRASARVRDILVRAPRDAPILLVGEVRPVRVAFDDSQ